jgi:hypothetical protein
VCWANKLGSPPPQLLTALLFAVAGLPMVDNVMAGYNSSIFAYGEGKPVLQFNDLLFIVSHHHRSLYFVQAPALTIALLVVVSVCYFRGKQVGGFKQLINDTIKTG